MDLLNPLDLTPYKFETYWLDNTYQIVLLELSSDTVLKKENYQVHTVYDLYNKPRDFINFASVKNHVIKAAINQLGAVSGKHCYVYRVTYALEHKKNIRGKIVHHDSEESYYHHILDDLILFDSQSDHQKYHQEHGIPFCDFITPRKKQQKDKSV